MDLFDLLGVEYQSDNGIKDSYEPADLIGDDGYLNIPRHVWAHLNEIYDKHTIRTMLTDCVFEFDLEPPYKVYTESQLWKDFSVLQNRDLSDFVRSERWFSPKPLNDIGDAELTFQGNHRYLLRGKNFGMGTSDHFSQVPRFMATNRDRKGITLTWGDRKTLYYAWNSLWGLKADKVSRDTIRNCIGMRRYKPAQFKPSVARYLYELFGAKRVLDPSAGWGDRLSGFLASNCTEHYVGIDPNTAMHPCYQKQFEFYSQRVNKRADFIHAPAEDADLSGYKEYFDFVFTSPPYFDAERYTTEDTQSFARYPHIDRWLQGFMRPTLRKCWDSLAQGGTMVINIVDVYNDHHKGTYKICKPILDFMATMPNCHYQGVIGYQMSVRPNRNQNENAHFADRTPQAEPMWIWTKGESTHNLFRQTGFWEL